jgi:predicted transcriptional regulator
MALCRIKDRNQLTIRLGENMLNSKSNELIAGLFSDSINIEILCSIYENEVTADVVANLLDLNEEEVVRHLEKLCAQLFVIKRQRENDVVYSLINPKVCDSILSLRDSIESGERII